MTRIGVDVSEGEARFKCGRSVCLPLSTQRILKYAFDLAQSRPRKKLTSASESSQWSAEPPSPNRALPPPSQEQRHLHHNAILGRACKGDERKVPRRGRG